MIINLKCELLEIIKKDKYYLKTSKGELSCNKLVLATGSNSKIWNLLAQLGHTIIKPVPSLFTFKIKDKNINELTGLSHFAKTQIVGSKFSSEGNLLCTHFGMSGPAILKLSAWGARFLNKCNYEFKIEVNWCVNETKNTILEKLLLFKNNLAKEYIFSHAQFNFVKRMWQRFLIISSIKEKQKWADLNNKQLNDLANKLTSSIYQVTGKTTFKEEFVTAGGLLLKEMNFKNYESKLLKDMYFTGEILNIDAITGGFNFQNAWTGGYIIADSIASNNF